MFFCFLDSRHSLAGLGGNGTWKGLTIGLGCGGGGISLMYKSFRKGIFNF